MQLDPAGAAVEAAGCLLDRALAEVEPDERDQPPAGALRELERPVVRRAKGRVAVGLVEAEHERARDPEPLLDPLELAVIAAKAVDVVPEMDVGVEDVGPLGELSSELGRPGFHQLVCALQRFLHPGSLCTEVRIGSASWRT